MKPLDLKKVQTILKDAKANGSVCYNAKVHHEKLMADDGSRKKIAMAMNRFTNSIQETLETAASKEKDHVCVAKISSGDIHQPTHDYRQPEVPGKLIGLSRLIWEFCVENGLKPTLDHQHDGGGMDSWYEITAHFGS